MERVMTSAVASAEKLMTPSEVAKRLGVSPITVRSWVSKGWLRSRVTPGGHRRFLWVDVERLMTEKRHAQATCRILVVDDDPQFRAFLIDALNMLLPSAEIHEAADGFQAGMLMAEFHPDLVLLDYAMPCMNGAAVCRLIKSNITPARVVALTGYADSVIQAELINAGADKLLFKPISLDSMKLMLEQFGIRASA